MPRRDGLVQGSQIVIRVAQMANRVFLGAVVAGLLLSWPLAAQYSAFLAQSIPGPDIPSALIGCRLLLLIGIVMSVSTEKLLASLASIVASLGAGDPFLGENAARLRTIGWSLLVLQLLEIAATLLRKYFPEMGAAAPNGEISITGWIAVLMVFVLSRVYMAGSVMRDELEGTV